VPPGAFVKPWVAHTLTILPVVSSQLSDRCEIFKHHLRSDLRSLIRKSYHSCVSPSGMAITARATGSVPPSYVVGSDGDGLSPSAELRESKSDAEC
jgi:hypothetical protein